MKKALITLGLLSALVLTGCTSLQRSLRGNDYVDSSISEESSSKVASQLDQDRKDALTNPKAVFPQLTKDVAENEAEVKITTTEGVITAKLFPKYAPLAVENFLTHAKEGYYNGVLFHRVIKDFMVQSGDPKGNGTGGESIWQGKDSSKDAGQGFKNEISPYLYNIRGALAMANRGADTNGSQFFINQNSQDQSKNLSEQTFPAKIIDAYKQGGNPSLDGSYTVFGQVIDGMDVVDKIASAETENDKPKTDIKIEKIEVIKDYKF
ncbi:peptidylprolyl isomerase [Streptococcus massiliensis]|uniref:Peptidyl-prolyl cis-trans isomerase n=1 Tax=Streptococcus massiliensis TaxID=313439 RepID=A0A380KYZ0_9STRE|nr:peptidylprolyl isomerase [Streptococcus massiliensis]SUN77224.1 cyclophilin type peptidyl-prolyl cis-trans isomerase [Streptococcus massiliensis]